MPETRAGRAVFSGVAATRPRASRPLARCDGYPPPHRDRVESMLGSGCCAPGPEALTARAMRAHEAGAGGAPGQALLPEAAGTRCVERGRANPACQRAPEISLDLRVTERPVSA